MTYTAVIKQSGFDWIGWIEEVPGVNCQESTREELRVNILIPFNSDDNAFPIQIFESYDEPFCQYRFVRI
jgi:hypothetical protein